MAQFLAQRWRRQPQGPVAVDWGNPLARGAVWGISNLPAFRPFLSRDSSAAAVGGSAGLGITSGLSGIKFLDNSAYFEWPDTGLPMGSSPRSVLFVQFFTDAASGGSFTFAGLNWGSVNNAFGINFKSGASDVYNWGSDVTFSSSLIATNKQLSTVVTHTGSAASYWLNGTSLGSQSQNLNTVSDGFVRLGKVQNGSVFTATAGEIVALAVVWNYALPVGIAAALSENPWQLFRAPRPIIYSLPGGATIPTLSAATAIDVGSTSARPRVTITI